MIENRRKTNTNIERYIAGDGPQINSDYEVIKGKIDRIYKNSKRA